MIGVDGVFHTFDYSIDADIHAVHWNGTTGEVEYKSKPEEIIDDFTPYEFLLVERTVSIEAEAKAITDAEAVKTEQALSDAITEEANRTPITRREMEYPSTSEQLRASYLARAGDASALDALDADIASIDLKYPE